MYQTELKLGRYMVELCEVGGLDQSRQTQHDGTLAPRIDERECRAGIWWAFRPQFCLGGRNSTWVAIARKRVRHRIGVHGDTLSGGIDFHRHDLCDVIAGQTLWCAVRIDVTNVLWLTFHEPFLSKTIHYHYIAKPAFSESIIRKYRLYFKIKPTKKTLKGTVVPLRNFLLSIYKYMQDPVWLQSQTGTNGARLGYRSGERAGQN